ncbi:hypothetical protein FGM00_07770 [Aggregatimonas sangjinii]|uniref:Uncharacterized protein n=1 Tax=Aggregatimonas sangjinii TaxID=2583587 RepID=A0A5B7SP93_9FLAO|nr:hypothetical protein [Aggregatimonas sangjinii]QCX00002.1 hypothetical protein FGM00_07770 [Aggregatimonas sangjinii]
MRLIVKFLKICGVLFLILLIAFGVLYLIYDQPLPKGKTGPQADTLAQKMLAAINNEQYQKTRFLEWSYVGGRHQYKWDKENGKVTVSWNDFKVLLNLYMPDKSAVFENGVEIIGDNRSELIETAISYFNNDSFWLVAPFKVFDKGTSRSLVALEDGSNGLLVTYSEGGTTPGDAYLWKLNDSGFPISYQMWVKIIPIGGLEATWDDWKIMENGLFLPTSHELGPITLSMGEVRAYD